MQVARETNVRVASEGSIRSEIYRCSFTVAQTNPRTVDECEGFLRHTTCANFEIIIEQGGERRIHIDLIRIDELRHCMTNLFILQPLVQFRRANRVEDHRLNSDPTSGHVERERENALP